MNSTGRITQPLSHNLRELVFGGPIGPDQFETLCVQTAIDRATIVMLVRSRTINPRPAAHLLRLLDRLEKSAFSELHGIVPERGLYLAYETYLRSQPDGELAADLQRHRSRNDLQAAAVKLRARGKLLRLQARIARLLQALQARAQDSSVIPLYTHLQPAVPTTAGHVFAGYCFEILADAERIADAARELDVSPLGAGPGGGVGEQFDPAAIAELLGFAGCEPNSLRAVASRNWVVALLGAMSVLGISLSRIATDLQIWTSEEFGFLRLPDHLVGSSSHMPQKRNPFLLEFVQGRAQASIGTFVGSACAMICRPFSNSYSVGQEGVRDFLDAIDATRAAVAVLDECVRGLQLKTSRMRDRASSSGMLATVAAELLAGKGMGFRDAHRVVGELVTRAEVEGRGFREYFAIWCNQHLPGADLSSLEPKSQVEHRSRGGGPAAESLRHQASQIVHRLRALRKLRRSARARYRAASHRLQLETKSLIVQGANT